ncbi:MAG: hypothetical protein NTZ93_02340 [Candidatus Beckwithbacteria bacterium]|nr:hypothetical protein [Candidatus Beckwithbacteria bacterium]
MAEHSFDWQVAGIAISKAFDQSFGQGVNQIGNEIKNVFAKTQEMVKPQESYFKTPLEIRDNKIYWQDYEQSISHSLLRNAALLRLNGASKEEIEKAKAEWKMWNRLEEKILGLEKGQVVQFLALRGIDPELGVALQQIKREENELVLESQLMPFSQIDQIENFRELLGEKGEDVSFVSESADVDPMVGWAVQGVAIDFQQDLPELISEAYQSVQPEFLSTQPRPFWSFSEIIPIVVKPEIQFDETATTLIEQSIEQENAIPVTSATSFWFKLAAASGVPNIIETPMPEFVTTNTILKSDTEMLSDRLPIAMISWQSDLEKASAEREVKQEEDVVYRQEQMRSPAIKRQELSRKTQSMEIIRPVEIEKTEAVPRVPVEPLPAAAVTIFESQHIVSPILIEISKVIPELIQSKQQSRRVSSEITDSFQTFRSGTECLGMIKEGVVERKAKQEQTERVVVERGGIKPTGIIPASPAGRLEGRTEKRPKIVNSRTVPEVTSVEKVVYQVKPKKQEVPVYQIPWPNWMPLKDIPEWVWRPVAAGPDEIIDWSWFLVTVFYALLNTKALLKVRVNENFSLNQGSGLEFLRR